MYGLSAKSSVSRLNIFWIISKMNECTILEGEV
jgi:hypothetical protein